MLGTTANDYKYTVSCTFIYGDVAFGESRASCRAHKYRNQGIHSAFIHHGIRDAFMRKLIIINKIVNVQYKCLPSYSFYLLFADTDHAETRFAHT